jgi:hypothetical protein
MIACLKKLAVLSGALVLFSSCTSPTSSFPEPDPGGWQLYSWQDASGQWHFKTGFRSGFLSSLPDKKGILDHAPADSVSGLERILASEHVTNLSLETERDLMNYHHVPEPVFVRPPEDVIREIKQMCIRRHISFNSRDLPPRRSHR